MIFVFHLWVFFILYHKSKAAGIASVGNETYFARGTKLLSVIKLETILERGSICTDGID